MGTHPALWCLTRTIQTAHEHPAQVSTTLDDAMRIMLSRLRIHQYLSKYQYWSNSPSNHCAALGSYCAFYRPSTTSYGYCRNHLIQSHLHRGWGCAGGPNVRRLCPAAIYSGITSMPYIILPVNNIHIFSPGPCDQYSDSQQTTWRSGQHTSAMLDWSS